MTFSVDSDALNYTEVNQLMTERRSVLADLDFEVLELSQGEK